MEINPLVGTKHKVIKMIADISSDKMYVHCRNLGNNINNIVDDVDRDQIKLFFITVGGTTHSICGVTYYHMTCNIEEAKIMIRNVTHCMLTIFFVMQRLNYFMQSLKIG